MSLAERRQHRDLHHGSAAPAARQRLTNSPAIDTSPCFSPDATRIVFNSDRGGSQQIYVMNADGGDVHAHQLRRRPLRHAGLVAARRSHRLHPHVRRHVLHRRHASRRQRRAHAHATAILVEGPTWAPNGRVLSFFREDGGGAATRLYTIDLTGLQRARVEDASGRLRSGLVALDSLEKVGTMLHGRTGQGERGGGYAQRQRFSVDSCKPGLRARGSSTKG